ncbi:zinc-binding dehydrogenase [Arthrobacter sp. zg-Y820]|uniref:zinc-binding dehydrogenase n=1 Tax=unclassified Arthrobacter TaxID=235627 RepID=UPI001E3FDA12|nr:MULTISPECIES: zinc-binding dehydrogenase [unclassified Arthrobacter]MCC9195462.1 zinc-binding dehydrogenase [Arthrobacter sp. zg-Y820]MDK1278321.1 zinc-binding dehydrogenase [Arthrobacter sp. zg.Y820]WIB10200.1 zinc-binding dehydrogenase [Arthrobacter sp. zg-Y820]
MSAGTMLAARLNVQTKEFALREVPIPDPGPGFVRVKVGAAGVCLSDVHLIQGLLHPQFLEGNEVTLGHEVAGTVDLPGPGVTSVAAGDRVVIQAGYEYNGVTLTMGVDYDGGWAEYVVVPAGVLVPLGDDIPFDQAAVIPDAVSTPWGAITSTADVRAGEAVGVWGIGGLGAHGVQLLRLIGAAPIIAVDVLPEARARALEFGADYALDPLAADFSDAMKAATAGNGLDVALDFAGVDAVRAQAVKSLGRRGRLVLVGLSGTPITISDSTGFSYARKQILGHYGSEAHHVPQLVHLTRLGRLDFTKSVSGRLPLSEAVQAVKQLDAKEGNPVRLVLIP